MPLQEKAYLSIQKMIENNELELGVVYSETKLSKMLDISRTPVRSALNRMAQDGYIDILPSRGFVLHEMTRSEFIDHIGLVCSIEFFAAHHCIQNPGRRSKCLKKVEQVHAKMETANLNKLAELNNEFHTTLIQMNGNLVMNRSYHNSMHLMRTQHEIKIFDDNDRERILMFHTEMLNRLRDGNKDNLFSLINEHIQYEAGIL